MKKLELEKLITLLKKQRKDFLKELNFYKKHHSDKDYEKGILFGQWKFLTDLIDYLEKGD